MISIIVPIRNEPDLLCFLDRLSVGFPETEIVLVDTSTNPCLQNRSMAGLQYVHAEHLHTRAQALNHGAKRASGEILLFVHADCQLPSSAQNRVVDAVSNGKSVGVFTKVYSPTYPLLTLQSRYLNRRAPKFLTGTNALYMTKSMFERLGPFPESPFMEDVLFLHSLRKRIPIHVIDDPVTVSSRRYQSSKIPFQIFRNGLIYGLFRLGLPVSFLKKLY